MKKRDIFLTVTFLLLMVNGTIRAQDAGDLSLCYDEPAQEWTQALPVGNGRLTFGLKLNRPSPNDKEAATFFVDYLVEVRK